VRRGTNVVLREEKKAVSDREPTLPESRRKEFENNLSGEGEGGRKIDAKSISKITMWEVGKSRYRM